MIGCLLGVGVVLGFFALIAWGFQQLILLAFGVEPAFWPLLFLIVLAMMVFGGSRS